MRTTLVTKEKHRTYYFLLTLLLSVALLATIFAGGYPKVQMMILLLATVTYVGIGILHHFLDHDVTAKIVIEYILIGSLGMALIVLVFR